MGVRMTEPGDSDTPSSVVTGRIRQPVEYPNIKTRMRGSKLLRNIPRTSLVVLTSLIPNVPGHYQLPANVTIDWAAFKDDRSNDLIFCLSLWRD